MFGCKTFCTRFLNETRKCLKNRPELLAMVKGWYVDRSGSLGDRWFWVRDRHRKIIWQGSTCCVYHAKAKALFFLEEHCDPGHLEACPYCDETYDNGCSDLDANDNCVLNCGRCGKKVKFKLGLVGTDRNSSGMHESDCM